MHDNLVPRVIRPSSLTTFSDCSRRWAARHLRFEVEQAGYTLNSPSRRHVGALVGTAVHTGAGWTLEQKLATGELGSGTEAEDRATASLKAEYEMADVMWDDTTKALPTAQKQVARMVYSYRRHLAWQLTPIAVEKRLAIDIGDGWQVSGQADAALAGDPHETIRDLKTGQRSRANAAQYGAYGVIWRSHGYDVRTLVEDFLARVRVDREQPPPVAIAIPVAEAAQHAWETIERIKATTAEFERRVADTEGRAPHLAFPANPASSLCSARYCPAHGTGFCRVHTK